MRSSWRSVAHSSRPRSARGRSPRASAAAPRATRAPRPRRAPGRSARAAASSARASRRRPPGRRAGSGSRSRRARRSSSDGLPERDDLALAEHGDPVGELLGLVEVVRREEDGLAELAAASGSCPTRRGGPAGSKPVVGSSRKSSSGSPTRPSARSSRRFWPPESVFTRALRFSSSPTRAITSAGVARARVVAGEQRDVLVDGQVRVHRRRLEHDADPLAPVAAGALRVDAEDGDAAAVALAVALEDLDRRRLAGAVRAEQAEDLALLDLEADAANGLDLAVRLAQVADGDGRRHASAQLDHDHAGRGEARLGAAASARRRRGRSRAGGRPRRLRRRARRRPRGRCSAVAPARAARRGGAPCRAPGRSPRRSRGRGAAGS